MSIVAAATPPIDPAAITTSTASQAVSHTSPPPSLVCDWAHCASGCFILDRPPYDVCGIDGCKSIFHHACACQWKEWHYHQDDPTGPPDKNPYNLEGLKQCTQHHNHHKKILQSSQDLSSSKIKQSAKEKKAKEQEWAKMR